MKNRHKLIAIVNSKNINELIKTKFYYANDKVFYNVTEEICKAIATYNNQALKVINRGKYNLIIPIRYNEGYAEYEFGFGETHYFQKSEFFRINKYIRSFPLNKCEFKIFTPNDIKTTFNSKIDDKDLSKKIHSYLYSVAR